MSKFNTSKDSQRIVTLSSRLMPNPAPVAESRGCISSTVRNRLSDVVVRKSISALGCRP